MAIFCRGFWREPSRAEETERGGASDMSMSCCMCEPMETAPSLGDDTHAVGARPKWTREHGIHAERGPIVSVGCTPGPSTSARTRTWAEVNVRPWNVHHTLWKTASATIHNRLSHLAKSEQDLDLLTIVNRNSDGVLTRSNCAPAPVPPAAALAFSACACCSLRCARG